MEIKYKAAILLWIYHTDLWLEFFELLKPLKNHINLYIGLYSLNTNEQIINDSLSTFTNVNFQYFNDNYGVDVRPFLHQINLVDPIAEPFVFKLHSKKSYLGKSGKRYINWRSILLYSLIGSIDIFLNNCKDLSLDNIGSICNEQLILENQEFKNTNKIIELCDTIGIDYKKINKKYFCGGNMFAIKTSLLQRYFNPNMVKFLDEKLKNETNKVSDHMIGGSYSHSLERVFGYINEYEHQIISASSIPEYKIQNTLAPNNYFHLIITHNGICYIKENMNMYGQLIEKNSTNMIIKWLHLDKTIFQKYVEIEKNVFKKLDY